MEIDQQTLLLILILAFIFYVMNMSNSSDKINGGKPEKFEQENFAVSLPQEQPSTIPSLLNESILTNMQTNVIPNSIVQADAAKKIMSDSIYNFQGNDDFGSGADLNSAFQAPTPVQNTADVVNINKNNEKYNSNDFLPKEINNKWFDTDFSQAKYNVNNDTLINTDRYVIGINTVGQSLKNASYDIRGTIPNPKYTISPWNNSTYEPDYNIKPLCNA
jgi:hypothetical protein